MSDTTNTDSATVIARLEKRAADLKQQRDDLMSVQVHCMGMTMLAGEMLRRRDKLVASETMEKAAEIADQQDGGPSPAGFLLLEQAVRLRREAEAGQSSTGAR